jgi:lysyl-tRNA synthetase, class I
MLRAMLVLLLLAAMGARIGAFVKRYDRDNVVCLIRRALAGDDLGKAA